MPLLTAQIYIIKVPHKSHKSADDCMGDEFHTWHGWGVFKLGMMLSRVPNDIVIIG